MHLVPHEPYSATRWWCNSISNSSDDLRHEASIKVTQAASTPPWPWSSTRRRPCLNVSPRGPVITLEGTQGGKWEVHAITIEPDYEECLSSLELGDSPVRRKSFSLWDSWFYAGDSGWINKSCPWRIPWRYHPPLPFTSVDEVEKPVQA